MRGMKKWLPFKSLNGQERVFNETTRRREDVERPILSEDEIDDLNRTLSSLVRGDNVLIRYYYGHRVELKEAVFLKAEPSEGRIYLYGFSLPFGMLLGIQRA